MIKLIFPCYFVGITQKYKSNHRAIDLGWSTSNGGPNHKIIAPYDGKITYVKDNYNRRDKTGSSYGNYVIINHDNGVKTLHSHLKYKSIKVKVGDKVKQGDVIGLMGDTGHATGIHLHYEVRINNSKVNPLLYTYATSKHKVGKNTKLKYKILYLKEEEIMEEKKEDTIEITDDKDDDIIFEYICTKTGMYKIQLNENEKLLIKD